MLRFFLRFVPLFVLLTLIVPQTVLAEDAVAATTDQDAAPVADVSIGISPGKVLAEMYPGRTEEETIFVSRSITEGDMLFDVSLTDDPLVDVHGQTLLTIPDGQNHASFTFTIDPKDAVNGSYESRIVFQLHDTSADTGGQGNSILYAVIERVMITVTNPPDASVPVNVESHPYFVDDIGLSDPIVAIRQSTSSSARIVHVAWNEKNQSTNALQYVPVQVTISRHDQIIADDQVENQEVLLPGSSALQGYDYNLDPSQPSGMYNIQVKVGDQKIATSVWILQPKLRSELEVILGALVLAALTTIGALAFDRHRKLKPGHHRS